MVQEWLEQFFGRLGDGPETRALVRSFWAHQIAIREHEESRRS